MKYYSPDAETLRNIEAEQYILGAVMNNNTSLAKINLEPQHFYEPLHGIIFRAMMENYVKGVESNPVLLKNYFNGVSSFEEVGGANYLLKLCSVASGIINVGDYARLIRNLSDRRFMQGVFEEKIKALHHDVEGDTSQLIEDLNQQFAELMANSSQYRMVSYESVLSEIAQDCQNPKSAMYTSTGFPSIDATMNGGLQGGRSYAFSARPKDGKTMLKGSIANFIRKANKKFLFIAAEMGRKEIAKRMVGSDLNIGFNQMNIDNKEFCTYVNSESIKQSRNMFFIDAPRITLPALITSVTNAFKTRGIEGFILDYLQLVTGGDQKHTIAQHQENVAQTIAELCKKYDIWSVYSCQINREGEIRNGDGIMMAVDWLYEINKISYPGAVNKCEEAWLKHIASRSFKAIDIGAENDPKFELSLNGTHFREKV